MDKKSAKNLSRLCVHTITTKPLSVETAVEKYASLGIEGITVWRDAFFQGSPKKTASLIRRAGLKTVSLCRGGFFPSVDPHQRQIALDDNLRALEEAAELEAPLLVLVCGADPLQPAVTSREQIRSGIELLLPRAEQLGVKLAVEPLHPMYADTRSAINTMKQANDLVYAIDSHWLGVAVDVYHVWWDEDLHAEIKRCGTGGKIFAFHVCDWKVPTSNMLTDRGLMGEGCINISDIRRMVEASGFSGFHEVEIFSDFWWERDQDEFLLKIRDAYLRCVL